MVDWADQIRYLVDVDFPWAEKVVLVIDNLNTQRPASLYEVFTPEEARRILDSLEIHYTPKHGSCLNMAEIEFSVLNHHGLSDRIPSLERMQAEVKAWVLHRNQNIKRITWRFTAEDARIKLARLYQQLCS